MGRAIGAGWPPQLIGAQAGLMYTPGKQSVRQQAAGPGAQRFGYIWEKKVAKQDQQYIFYTNNCVQPHDTTALLLGNKWTKLRCDYVLFSATGIIFLWFLCILRLLSNLLYWFYILYKFWCRNIFANLYTLHLYLPTSPISVRQHCPPLWTPFPAKRLTLLVCHSKDYSPDFSLSFKPLKSHRQADRQTTNLK